MRTKLGSLIAVLLLTCAARAAAATPCVASATSLCLSGGRFEVKVAWTDFQGKTGDGQAINLTADTGYFWFFNSSNIELVVKVLDARGINQKFWVFFGALSNVEYTLTVTDSQTGAVKTYFNPSGQFASVGDTGAFEGSVEAAPVASRLAVTAEGTAAPPSSIADIQRFIDRSAAVPAARDAAPCPGPSGRLFLANCRFAVDVEWTASPTNFGSGQPVSLTSDTGYFWFFNDTNVELMIKVLDARPIDGKFWVFFGALSNVEYTVSVTDTVSGALKTYHNPASTFASVGDTGAFRGGYAISVQTDDALTATGTITAVGGGSLSASAADGTVFTLTVPPNAIEYDQAISMTPVSSVSSLPFAGGLAAGVDLEPSGLVLLTGATLTIHTPARIPSSEETPVAWNGSGDDFFLFPPTPAGGDLQLLISHFAGYGVAHGTDAERTAQLAREPLDDGDLLEHQSSATLRAGRAAALPAGSLLADATDWRAAYKAQMDAAYALYKSAMTNFDGNADLCIQLVLDVLSWKRGIEGRLGPLDSEFPGRSEEIHSLFTSMVKNALASLHSRCQLDVRALDDIPPLLFIASWQGLDVQIEADEAVRCLSFTLDFKSTISASQPTPQGVLVIKESVHGNLVLTTPTYPSLTAGSGNIASTAGSIDYAANNCAVSYAPATAQFRAYLRWNNLFNGGNILSKLELTALYYSISDVASTLTLTCPGGEPAKTNSWWFNLHLIAHQLAQPVLGYEYERDGFRLTGTRSPWATAHQTAPPVGLHIDESTDFRLDHTPQ